MRFFVFVFFLVSIVGTAGAQDFASEEELEANIGFGVGLDYGGVGTRFAVPVKTNFIKLIAGVGWNFLDIGFNGGIAIQPLSKGPIRPNIIALYGYNGVLKNTGNHPRFDRTYYGPSLGGSVEIHWNNSSGNFVNIGALVPVHLNDYKDALDGAKDNFKKPIPVVFSVGYHLIIGL